jgi:Autotransporter beta-domain
MIALICFVLAVLASPFKSKIRLEAENAALRHQLIVLRRKRTGRPWLTNNDRWFFLQMYRWFPSILKVVRIIQPETLVRWHRAGFRCYWRWNSLGRGGRPQIETELRALIRRMSIENPLWGAPRIHGELLKLGLAVAQSSVAKYMVKRRGPPSQGWCTFLHNPAPDIARTDKSFAMPDGIITLRGRFAWAHDFDPDRSIAATFQTLPGASFVVNGAAQARDSALTTASVEMKWVNGWSAAATFEGEFSNVTSSYAGKGVVRYAW